MVAISLYRGNLHRLPSDVPRRWLMPTHGISIKDFRSLLCRRSKALSLLPSSSSSVVENPNPNFNLNPVNSLPPPNQSDFKGVVNPNLGHEPSSNVEVRMSDAGDSAQLDHPPLLIDEDVKMLVEIKENENEKKEKEKESAPVVDNPNATTLEGDEKVDEKEKRKREVEEKLHILNEKKHNLVQALKQILSAEEELKRRSSMQASRPPLPLQVDVSNDSGSMTRHATPRTGSEANLNVDMEGGEGDDAVNNNPQSRQLLCMSSTSPSAESALRRAPYFQHNAAPHPS
ncbi:uncharacterized protein LOC110726547 [Chenopodium quinoa]|uniref:uncharacterized protein LOC110726547 n=1 Tax=Chenopodium quinoa TaxID=63459 RepID=UPI000B7954BD|nr:uncharacterized protein LOC110726547 [Chenopodium quinoa]